MKIGIYGGSFNPIHIGHTSLAQAIVRQGLVDEVWFLVSPLNPLKQNDTREIAPYEHRIRMVEIATKSIKGVRVSDFENHLPIPSYTINTLNALSEEYPQHEFVLLVGADNWQRFDRWYKHEEIKANYQILVYRRPGYEIDCENIVDTPLFDISSTQIRHAIREGDDSINYINNDVLDYIKQHNLYR